MPGVADRTESARNGTVISPDDNNDLAHVTRGVWVGTAGDLKVMMVDDTVAIVIPNASGMMSIAVKRIYATLTTATGIVAFR